MTNIRWYLASSVTQAFCVLWAFSFCATPSAEAALSNKADPHILSTRHSPEYELVVPISSLAPAHKDSLPSSTMENGDDIALEVGDQMDIPKTQSRSKTKRTSSHEPSHRRIREGAEDDTFTPPQEDFMPPESGKGLPAKTNFQRRAYIRTMYNSAAMQDGRRIEIQLDQAQTAHARVIEKDGTKTLVPDGHYEIHNGQLRRLQNNNFELRDDTSILLSVYKGQVINYLPRIAVVAGEFENFFVPEPEPQAAPVPPSAPAAAPVTPETPETKAGEGSITPTSDTTSPAAVTKSPVPSPHPAPSAPPPYPQR